MQLSKQYEKKLQEGIVKIICEKSTWLDEDTAGLFLCTNPLERKQRKYMCTSQKAHCLDTQ